MKKFARWCEEMMLVALPAHPDVINLYLQHRLHEDGLDTSTTELDVQAISAWHVSAQVAFQSSSLPNPAKWLSVKSTVLKYYASLSVEHAIVIIASLSDIASASLTTTSFSTRP